ncbi:MAG TPA: cupin domain-containing protein [Gaiellaceae bacterium]|nr:cupin domain-containing protein [Gaiellaceae bacterium]
MAVPEAPLEATDLGLVCKGDGWFVVNARDVRWRVCEGRDRFTNFAGDTRFEQLGIGISVMGPGEPMALYHWENDQEDFLVLSGEGTLVVEGEERPLRQWDFFHCPPGTKHVIVGGPIVVLAVGARQRDGGEYVADPVAAKHGAAPPRTMVDGAYEAAGWPGVEFARYGGWLD